MAEPPTTASGAYQAPSASVTASTTSSSSVGAITPGAAAALASIAALTARSGHTPGGSQPFAGQLYAQGSVYDAKKAQLDQKKKLLWGRKKQEVESIETMQVGLAHQNKQQWRAAEFGGNQAEKARFLKMMGDKQGAAAAEDEMTKLRAAQEEDLERLDKLHEGASSSKTAVRQMPRSPVLCCSCCPSFSVSGR